MDNLESQIKQLTKEREDNLLTAKLQDAWYEGRIYQLQELLRLQTASAVPKKEPALPSAKEPSEQNA